MPVNGSLKVKSCKAQLIKVPHEAYFPCEFQAVLTNQYIHFFAASFSLCTTKPIGIPRRTAVVAYL